MRTRPGPFVINAIYDADGTLISYLVGTLHVPDAVPLLAQGKLLRVLHEWAATTILEVDLPLHAALPSLHDLQGPILTQIADIKLCRDADHACGLAGLDPALASQLPALVLWLLLTRSIWPPDGCMDQAVRLLANHQGNEIIGLETLDDQWGALERPPADELCVSIRRVVDLWLRGEGARQAFRRRVMRLYEQGRVAELLRLDELRALMPKTARLLLDERDHRWVERLATLLPGRRSYVAVGLGHMPGVVQGLRQRGFWVVPVLPPSLDGSLSEIALGEPVSWPAVVERQASAMLGGAPIVSALCTPGAVDTRTPVFLSDGNLSRKHMHGVPAPNLFWFTEDPQRLPLEFEDSYTRVTIQAHHELLAGGQAVRLSRLRCEDKPAGKQVLGLHEVVVAQLDASGWDFCEPVEQQGWRPAMLVAMQRGDCLDHENLRQERWVRELSVALVGDGRVVHLVTDHPRHPPHARRAWCGHQPPVAVHKLGRLSRRWGCTGHTLRGATVFRIAPRV